MSVFRVHKTRDYTVMSNSHFREKEMTLKAKGLHSLMLSLPEDWDFSIAGLTTLSKDGKDSVMGALNELEKFGYLKRTRLTNQHGRFAGYDYDIFEQPQWKKPYAENPNTDNPNAENPRQLNTNQSNTNKQSTKEENKESKKGSFDQLINDFVLTLDVLDREAVESLLKDWLKVRKAKRAAMTDKSIELNLRKLKGLASESHMTIENYLEAVIMRGWQAFYPIKEHSSSKPSGSAASNNPFLDIAKEEHLI